MKKCKALVVFSILTFSIFSFVWSEGFSGDFSDDFMKAKNPAGASGDVAQDETFAEQKERTEKLIKTVTDYLDKENVMVAFISRRGAPKGNPKKGMSDVDAYDVTGMAHTGIIIRTTLCGEPPKGQDKYLTFNLVRMPNGVEEGKDSSEMRVWTLMNFFIGCFQKDAGIFIPKEEYQTMLWNRIMNGGQLEVKRRIEKVNGQEVLRQVISNGLLKEFHNPDYSLLSDYAGNETQNCNEHLLKVYLCISKGIEDINEISNLLEREFKPHLFKLGSLKTFFANVAGYNLATNEQKKTEKGKAFRVITVQSFVIPENQTLLDWKKVQFFREELKEENNQTVSEIRDMGSNYKKH